jgi:hypothetical protein
VKVSDERRMKDERWLLISSTAGPSRVGHLRTPGTSCFL